MSSYCANIKNGAKDLWDNIPQDTPSQVAKSFAVSFALGTLFTFNPVVGLITGTVAATACVVNSLANSTLKTFFNMNSLNWWQQALKFTAVILATSALLTLSVPSVPLVAVAVGISLLMSALQSEFGARHASTARADLIILA